MGLHIDSRLMFKKHIDYLSEKFWGRISLAISLIGRRSPLSLENKVILYKQILRPVITYGSPVWGAAAATHMKKIQVMQNKILRVMTNAPCELLAIKETLILYSTHLELSGTTEGLTIFSDSRVALEAIIKGDTNITSAINVLLESLHCKGKSCLLQWIPAHVNIEGNECADSLAKEGRNDDQLCPTITLADANAVAIY
ncbi:putative RNA-directed DNA polymerase from transposon X-element [Trichonephila clavipes]|nr:putative RNA-directed DNA polymerase from transposon X-element [Trichonephila clavipes]